MRNTKNWKDLTNQFYEQTFHWSEVGAGMKEGGRGGGREGIKVLLRI